MNRQSGFTLIELVVVLVILGILAAVAVPRFIDLTEEAEQAGVQGVAGAISSGSAINFAAAKAGNPDGVQTEGQDCADAAAALLQGGAIPDGYSVSGGTVSGTEGDVHECTVEVDGGTATAPANILVVE